MGNDDLLNVTVNSMPSEINIIRDDILNMVTASQKFITPIALEKAISNKYLLDKKQAKSIVRDLNTAGELVYTYKYGCTFIEKSFRKPIRISKHVVLKPPENYYRPEHEDVVVQLGHGASFGTGEHPTTRLSVKGIEHVLKSAEYLKDKNDTSLLDIGTGSGILVITAVLFGIKKGVGIDIDPCARAEARENVRLNGLQDKIDIADQPVENISGLFSIITANLRYPTIKKLSFHIDRITDKNGFVIISGIKATELDDVLHIYAKKQFRCLWKDIEKDWAGVALKTRFCVCNLKKKFIK